MSSKHTVLDNMHAALLSAVRDSSQLDSAVAQKFAKSFDHLIKESNMDFNKNVLGFLFHLVQLQHTVEITVYSRELGRWPCWRASALWLGDRTGVLLFLHPSCILLSSQKLDLLGWPSQVVWAVMGGHRFHSVSVKRSSFLLQPSHSSSLPRSLDYRRSQFSRQREPILPAKRANSSAAI